jgi:hypothetical protein
MKRGRTREIVRARRGRGRGGRGRMIKRRRYSR